MESLKGKTAWVTGASAGIGAATARALGQQGAHVLLSARREDRLEELAAELPSAEVLALDVCDPAQVKAAVADRTLDIVVACAGLARGLDMLQDGDPADWAVTLDTNLKGVLHVVHAALPGLIRQGHGDLVFLGSVAGRQVYPGGNVYCASKYGVRAVYEALRMDAGGKGVRYTTVDPGMVETDFTLTRLGDPEAAAKVYENMHPLSAEDVADAVLFAVTRPKHVNIGEIVLWPTCQASTRDVTRDS